MGRLRLLSALTLALLLIASPSAVRSVASEKAGQTQADKKEVKVWVNTRSGVYHCPGTRWHGSTKQGEYMASARLREKGIVLPTVARVGQTAPASLPSRYTRRSVREQLLRFAADKVIGLTAWDGLRERPYNEWPDMDSFFFNWSDGGYVRIRVLSAGGELLSSLPKAPIGFAATSK